VLPSPISLAPDKEEPFIPAMNARGFLARSYQASKIRKQNNPTIRIAPVIRKFGAKPIRSATIPATIGATIPAKLPRKFIVPPTLPTVPLGAINEGILQAIGAAKAKPPREIVNQVIATLTFVVKAAPIAATPSSIPTVNKNPLTIAVIKLAIDQITAPTRIIHLTPILSRIAPTGICKRV
jgi:hypothetical protein